MEYGSGDSSGSPASTAAPTPPEWARGTTLVFTDGEPDDLEFFLLLALMLKDVQPKPKFVIVAGGASVDVTIHRLQLFFDSLERDGMGLNYEMIRGMSDPLNAKNTYCEEFLGDAAVDESIKSATRDFLSMSSSFSSNKTDVLKKDAAEKALSNFDGSRIKDLIIQGCDVVCIKKPDELVALFAQPGWNASKSNIWFYAGGYNIDPPKHDKGGNGFREQMLNMLRSFGQCTIVSAFVVINGPGERDILALNQYKSWLRTFRRRSARLLEIANLKWSASMLHKWMTEAGLQLLDVGSKADCKTMSANVNNSSMAEWQKKACVNILKDPAYQRVIADQLVALLMCQRFQDQRVNSGSLAWKTSGNKQFLEVSGEGQGALEVTSIGASDNAGALKIIDDAMTACLRDALRDDSSSSSASPEFQKALDRTRDLVYVSGNSSTHTDSGRRREILERWGARRELPVAPVTNAIGGGEGA